MEAFSDGVFAIAITLLVLEISIPARTTGDLLQAVIDEWPSYLAYFVSFSTIGAVRASCARTSRTGTRRSSRAASRPASVAMSC
jgi:uncharacterized membrane protein